MRLTGYSCRSGEPPLLDCHLPLGPLTVLLGPNDSGKSSLLRALEQDLRGGRHLGLDDEARRFVGGVFFAAVSDGELDSLIDQALNVRKRLKTGERSFEGVRPPYFVAGFADDLLEKDAQRKHGDWIVAERGGGSDPIADALETSRIVALEPAGMDDGVRVWNVYWCLPPIAELEPDVRSALEASQLSPFRERRERAEAEERGENIGWHSHGFYPAFHGIPRHLWGEGAPVVVSGIGQVRSAHLPLGLAVPTDFPQLRRAVAEALDRLVSAARYGLEDVTLDGDDLTPEQRERRAIPRSWLDAADGAWRIHPDAVAAAAFIGAAATRLLPGFAARRYRIELDLPELSTWVGTDRTPLDIQLRPLPVEPLQLDFPIEQVADGLRLWVQLALLEACEQAARVAASLDDAAGDWWPLVQEAGEAERHDAEEAADLSDQADHYEKVFRHMVQDLRDLHPDRRPWLEGELAERLTRPDPEDWTRRAARHRRFYVVDEPERHLHPSLQREAAVWLRDTASDRDAPCLVATHSTPFLALPTDGTGPLYVYIRRAPTGVVCEPFDAGKVLHLEEIAGTLGFDRGELLTTVSLFLVVEGIHDLLVMEEVFDELRDARIALLPMEGVANYQAVIDSDALWRYTNVGVALTTDKFESEVVRKILESPDAAAEARRAGSDEELKVLAKLAGHAERSGKSIQLLGHRGADLIDVLDEDIVQQEFPKYPGHAEATRLWDEQVAEGAKAKQKKSFYEQHFGLQVHVETYRRLGVALRAAGRKPAALQAIVDDAVRLSRGEPPSDGVTAGGYTPEA